MLALACFLAVGATARTETDKNRPVTKVINLLKDMSKQLEKEAEEDEEVYEKVACWCSTNDKDKTTSISDAEARISSLTASIEEGTAQSARLNTEIKNLGAEVSKNNAGLDKATAIRESELAEFNAEEKDLLQSIGALKSAVTVLGKHNALIQVPDEQLISIAAMVADQFRRHKDVVTQLVTPSQRKAVTAFVQAPADYFDEEGAPGFKQSYAPQSGQIFGILKQMKETFETNLSASQKEEMEAQEQYNQLKAAKLSEIKAGEDQRDTKVQELANTDSKTAQDKQDLEDTRNSLSADQAFLLNLKETCQNTDAEWEARQKERATEVEAVSQALSILSSDDAHDTFTSTFNFVQRASTAATGSRAAAAAVLMNAAQTLGKPRLSALASRVRLDGFQKVVAAVDGMVVDLKQEKADDIKHKDYCNEQLTAIDQAQVLKSRDNEGLDAKIADLTSQIEALAKAIAQLQAEMAEMRVQLKRAGEDRELQNSDFQQTVADQRQTQTLLNQALNVLKAVYEKSFVQAQRGEPAGPPPPPGFKTYKKQGGSGGVLGMLEQIIADAKQLEADAIKAETDSQKAYESFVKDTNKSLEEKTRDVTSKSDTKAQAEVDKTAAEEARDAGGNEQQQNKNEEADLHKACDFTLQNFEVKQAALDQEVEALGQAKAILSGAGFAAFLQKRV